QQPSATTEIPSHPPAVSNNSISAWFDRAANDYLTSDGVVSEFNFGANEAFTIEGWFQLTTAPASGITQSIFSNRGGNNSENAGLSILVNQNGGLIFSADAGPGGPVNVNSGNGTITTDTWYYFAAIRTSTGRMQLYLGGMDPEVD